MPIKLWWWVEPLFYTGLFHLLIFSIVTILVDKILPDSLAAFILAACAIVPFLIAVIATLIWIIVNGYVLMWI